MNYNKVWKVRGHDEYRGKKLKFPRGNKFEDVRHESMFKRPRKDARNYYNHPYLDNYSKLYRLISKFVNKPYVKLEKVFQERTKGLRKKYGLNLSLKRYIEFEKPAPIWKDLYYVDDKGILRIMPAAKRDLLTKEQKAFNSRIKLPDWGKVTKGKFELVYYAPGYYITSNIRPYRTLKNEFNKPQLIGNAYVIIDKRVYFLPLYHCPGRVFDVYNHCKQRSKYGRVFDVYNHCSISSFDKLFKDELKSVIPRVNIKKAYNILSNWISVNAPNVKKEHFIIETEENQKYKSLLYDLMHSTDLEEKNNIQSKLRDQYPMRYFDSGFGKLNFFVKKSDYELVK